MGLDCSHDAFHGAYSAFNSLRQIVTAAAGGSFPPHWKMDENMQLIRDSNGYCIPNPDIQDGYWVVDASYTKDKYPGLYEFLEHSDCDGEIPPEMCTKVADELEALIPKVVALNWPCGGHIEYQGGWEAVLRKFIAGCRWAAERYEPLEFG